MRRYMVVSLYYGGKGENYMELHFKQQEYKDFQESFNNKRINLLKSIKFKQQHKSKGVLEHFIPTMMAVIIFFVLALYFIGAVHQLTTRTQLDASVRSAVLLAETQGCLTQSQIDALKSDLENNGMTVTSLQVPKTQVGYGNIVRIVAEGYISTYMPRGLYDWIQDQENPGTVNIVITKTSTAKY